MNIERFNLKQIDFVFSTISQTVENNSKIVL